MWIFFIKNNLIKLYLKDKGLNRISKKNEKNWFVHVDYFS